MFKEMKNWENWQRGGIIQKQNSRIENITEVKNSVAQFDE